MQQFMKRTSHLIISLSMLVVAGACQIALAQTLDSIVASVNGEAITNSAVQARMRIIRFDEQQLPDARPLPAEQLRDQALEEEITLRIQLQQAEQLGIRVSEQQLERAVAQIIGTNDLMPEEYLSLLEQSGITEEQFRKNIHDQLIQRQIVELMFEPNVRISDELITRYLDANQDQFEPTTQYNLDIVSIGVPDNPSSEYLQQVEAAAFQIVAALREGLSMESLMQEVAQIPEIEVVRLGWIGTAEIVPELREILQDITEPVILDPMEYQGNTMILVVNDYQVVLPFGLQPGRLYRLSQIRLSVRQGDSVDDVVEQMNALREQIVAGSDFAQIARENSDDSETRNKGGDMGWLERDRLPNNLVVELEKLNPGDVTSVFPFGSSVHLFQLVDLRLQDEIEIKRKFVNDRLRSMKVNEDYSRWLRELRSNASIDFRTNY